MTDELNDGLWMIALESQKMTINLLYPASISIHAVHEPKPGSI
jgi:hypothetical protein